MQRIRQAALAGPGELDPAVRRAIATRTEVPQTLAPFTEKVHRHAYRVVDADVAALRAAGYTEDEIFEATVAAAVGAGFARLDAGLRALKEER